MPSKNEKISKSMEGNTNAEKWTKEEAEKLFKQAIDIAETTMDSEGNKEFDFIGEVAVEQSISRSLYDYLCEKFPELNSMYSRLKSICEANCFRNAKKGNIVPSLGIINLKSNHGWKDRMDNTSGDEPLKPIQITKETVKAISDQLDDLV